ncbi:MAG: diphosphomevalonate/mevalonate 3,5-bisphosphate decarboxylase family protein [Salinivirgaceae bacterium]
MNKISWQSPSNIALIKYWGKTRDQIPTNPSISFTLEKSYTETMLSYEEIGKKEEITVNFLFDGEPKPDFEKRLVNYLNRVLEYIPTMQGLHLKIESRNSFPHSSGIASSASSYSALALCLVSMEEKLMGTPFTPDAFYQKASLLARLGSGSAARSVYGGCNLWGKTSGIAESSNLYSVPLNHKVHPDFLSYKDAILLVSKSTKKVSSSVGHQLMDKHPFAEIKFKESYKNTEKMLSILKTGDAIEFAHLVEAEALSLHAMMMTSNPAYLLMEPHTLAIIRKIGDFRHDTGIPACFTLDAGANVHLLYPAYATEQIHSFIKKTLMPYCFNYQWIDDQFGGEPMQPLEK